ncbi:probable D-xylulose reductase A [Athalia rosae]|uniref:probable D-xylulose reductase A n=1 Tax=Athalia rosae TaxID=37344 RepID=UPI0020347C90|nr:probable D-xylulose reductase A [Athalia rosae]
MEFLNFNPRDKSLKLEEAPVPVPAENEVLIRVSFAGVSETDIQTIEGSYPRKENEDAVLLGREIVGVVQAIGSAVTTLSVGQAVAVNPNEGCDVCNFCRAGGYNHCQKAGAASTPEIWRNGGWRTHALVPEKQVYLVPAGVTLSQAVLAEPLSYLAHSWAKINPVEVGTGTLVIGAGILGFLWASLLHLHGLRKTVTIIEPRIKRRKLFEKLDLGFRALDIDDVKGEEFDLVIDCSGAGSATETALTSLGSGGRLCLVGSTNPLAEIKFKPFQATRKEFSIIGAHINQFTFGRTLSLITAMGDTYLDYEKLGIGVYKLSRYEEALAAVKTGDITKAVFKF